MMGVAGAGFGDIGFLERDPGNVETLTLLLSVSKRVERFSAGGGTARASAKSVIAGRTERSISAPSREELSTLNRLYSIVNTHAIASILDEWVML